MMLTLETSKLEKAFIRKFENGIGIKSLNQLTGRENTVIIRAKNKSSENKNIIISMDNEPKTGHVSTDYNKANNNKMAEDKVKACNDFLAKLTDQYLKSNNITCNINGLHLFLEENTLNSSNIQKRSVIFVTNKDVARKEGAYLKIPGTLINLVQVNSMENQSIFELTADTIVKPMTIIVGEYTLHIDICCKISSDKITHSSVGTQTSFGCLQYACSKNNTSSIGSKNDLPQYDTVHINTREEVDHFNGKGTQEQREEITEQLREDEFAMLFNPKESYSTFTENSHSTTLKEDFISSLFICNEFNDDLRSQDNPHTEYLTERKSENSIKTFDSHTGLSTYSFSNRSISQAVISHGNLLTIQGCSVPESNILHNYSNHMLNKRSKSVGTQVSSRKVGRSSRESKSKHVCSDTQEDFLKDKQMVSYERRAFRESNKITHSTSSDVSLHKIKQQLDNVANSLNKLNSFVQTIDHFSQKSTSEKNKDSSSNNDIENQYKQVLDNLHAQQENNKNQTINSLCDRCGLFHSVQKPVNDECDQTHVKHYYCNLEGDELQKNELKSWTTNCIHISGGKDDSILNNTTEKICKSENLDSFTNMETLDPKTSKKPYSKQEIHGMTMRNVQSISKSTHIIHYNEKYQNFKSKNTSLSHLAKSKNDNAITPVKIDNLKKTLHNAIGETKNTSIDEEFMGELTDEKPSSGQIYYAENLLSADKTEENMSSRSTRELIQLNKLSKSLPIKFKTSARTKQNNDRSKTLEKFRFQHIANLVKTKFHKTNGTSSSSKTLHIVPSKSTTNSVLSNDKTTESIRNIDKNNSVDSLSQTNSKKQPTEMESVSKINEPIKVNKNIKHALNNRDTNTKINKKWFFFNK